MAKEYIEREALMKHISANGNPDNLPDGYVATPNDVYVFAIAAAESFPAADVVEVVRCKDCKHWKKGNFQAGNDLEHMEYGGSCNIVRFARYESDFCNCGERRDNNA